MLRLLLLLCIIRRTMKKRVAVSQAVLISWTRTKTRTKMITFSCKRARTRTKVILQTRTEQELKRMPPKWMKLHQKLKAERKYSRAWKRIKNGKNGSSITFHFTGFVTYYRDNRSIAINWSVIQGWLSYMTLARCCWTQRRCQCMSIWCRVDRRRISILCGVDYTFCPSTKISSWLKPLSSYYRIRIIQISWNFDKTKLPGFMGQHVSIR